LTNHHTDAPPGEGLEPVGAGEPAGWEGGLPDLTGIDLDTLRAMDHPALSDVIELLVQRTLQPSGVLCQFTNSV
jgi:hypothetical protein